ncbi:MAG: DUF2203 domain-containing protein [Sporichthyaceae bacterium]|nr:DUF2203 domain-containing protein [Sporichthyaceae bacterium]
MVTLEQARAILDELQPEIEKLLLLRADLAEIQADLLHSGSSPLGALADAKALEARFYAGIEALGVKGAEVKGIAPLLLDFPGERDGVPVLWCWLEGDTEINWFHRADCGFPGRRPI